VADNQIRGGQTQEEQWALTNNGKLARNTITGETVEVGSNGNRTFAPTGVKYARVTSLGGRIVIVHPGEKLGSSLVPPLSQIASTNSDFVTIREKSRST